MSKFKKTVISKNSLILSAKGENEYATQIFNYDLIREVRLDLETLDVKILMTYEDSFFRVFSVVLQNNSEEEKTKAKEILLNFYNGLINASMKLNKEEYEKWMGNQNKFKEIKV